MGLEDAADGLGNCWGNLFKPDPPEVPPWETWTETEWRVKANSRDQADGDGTAG